MITRIVRMEFAPDKVGQFLQVFETYKSRIRNFPGVLHLELHRDASQANVYYTYSQWKDAESLEAYRLSEVFTQAWSQSKACFCAAPQAFSLLQQMVVEP